MGVGNCFASYPGEKIVQRREFLRVVCECLLPEGGIHCGDLIRGSAGRKQLHELHVLREAMADKILPLTKKCADPFYGMPIELS